ncbi:hypothetical protein FCV63_02520 [Vibrio lentus]|uniref:hypothetical protein n=1 Tax=Vibrio lentus TaxID=136468 RepID=UPI0010BDCAEB|nr:hypothetical protein [Vibrio lentus]TKF60434.1 hypothetical protein FCV63_02520 [Vibrio lentus]
MRELSYLLGTESFESCGHLKVIDFWKWSYSALGNPFIRGYLAEFLVFEAIKYDRKQDESLLSFENNLFKKNYETKMESDVHDLNVYQNKIGNYYKRSIQVKSTDTIVNKYDFSAVRGYDYFNGVDILDKKNWSDLTILCKVNLDGLDTKKMSDDNKHLNNSNDKDPLYEIAATEAERYRNHHMDINNWEFSVICSYKISDKRDKLFKNQKGKVNEKGELILKPIEKFLQSKSHDRIKDLATKTDTGEVLGLGVKFHQLRSVVDRILDIEFDSIQQYSAMLDVYEKNGRAAEKYC